MWLIAGNYDINQIYIDDILEILNAKHLETAIAFLDQLEALTKEYECDITLTLGARDEDELNLIKKYEYQEA